MNTVIIEIKNKKQFRLLTEFLQQLLPPNGKKTTQKRASGKSYDFFKSAGMWEDYDISADDLRKKRGREKDNFMVYYKL